MAFSFHQNSEKCREGSNNCISGIDFGTNERKKKKKKNATMNDSKREKLCVEYLREQIEPFYNSYEICRIKEIHA